MYENNKLNLLTDFGTRGVWQQRADCNANRTLLLCYEQSQGSSLAHHNL